MRSPPPSSCHTRPTCPQPTREAAPPTSRRWARWRHRLGLGPPGPAPGATPASGGAGARAEGAAQAPPQADAAWAHVLRLLPADLEATARATGALRRRRGVGSAAALLWLVLA